VQLDLGELMVRVTPVRIVGQVAPARFGHPPLFVRGDQEPLEGVLGRDREYVTVGHERLGVPIAVPLATDEDPGFPTGSTAF
jgi:hypothetical protein